MISIRRLPFAALCRAIGLLLAFCTASSLSAQAPEIKWRGEYNAARKEAQDKNLPLLIDFRTATCPWCDRLDNFTLRDAGVVSVVSDKFIALKIDADREPKLRDMLGISAFPTVVLAAPDGKILTHIVGFKEPAVFNESLQKALTSITPPDWMQRDFQLAQKSFLAGDYPRAINALKIIIEDGKGRPVQADAKKLLAELEKKAEGQLEKAKQLQESGETAKAIEMITEMMRSFPGLQATKDAADLLTKVAAAPDMRAAQRAKRAAELLVQAKEYFKTKEYVACLDRCETLLAGFGDLPEGQEASLMLTEIKGNPDSLQQVTEIMAERLGGLYLSLADSLLKRGQPDRAAFYLARVVQAFPGSRVAESAQIRLDQLAGTGVRPTGISVSRP